MDFRDRSIITQVAFKGAIDLAKGQLDLATAEGTAQFEVVFEYLTNSLFGQIGDPEEQAAKVIQAHFPGAVQVPMQQQPQNPQPQPQPQMMQPQMQQSVPFAPAPGQLVVKGAQFGPLPDWLFEQAAAKGVVEVYDNRATVGTSRRPWFKSTSGGENAPAFWPPR